LQWKSEIGNQEKRVRFFYYRESVTRLVGRVTPSRGGGDFVSLPNNQVSNTIAF